MAIFRETAVVYSWGGGNLARGWSGPSVTGVGPAKPVPGSELNSSSHFAVPPMVAASRNSLALASDGRVLTWGVNDSRGGGDAWFVRGGHVSSIPDSGQLGRSAGRGTKPEVPAAMVSGPLAVEGAKALASGRYHALAIGLRSQLVYSWGLNDHGQLGRSGWADARVRSHGSGRLGRRDKPPHSCMRGSRCRDGTARPVESVPASVSVAAGRYFSVAIGTDGRAHAWGRCACGMPPPSPRFSDASRAPAHIDLVESSASSAPDESRNSGEASRWTIGQPEAVGGYRAYVLSGGGIEAERLVAAAVGYTHLLLLGASGTLYSCESGDDGYGGRLKTAPPPNAFGQLGRSGSPFVPHPVPGIRLASLPAAQPSSLATLSRASISSLTSWETSLRTARTIAAGRCASFAIDADGAVYSWGCAQANGHFNSSGSGRSAASSLSSAASGPADVRAPRLLEALRGTRTRMLAAGEYHALAATADSRLLAWGAAASGVGGAGGLVGVQGLPAASSGSRRCAVLDIAAGYQHSLAVVQDCYL